MQLLLCVCTSVCVSHTTVSPEKQLNQRSGNSLRRSKEPCIRRGTCGRHLANTIECSVPILQQRVVVLYSYYTYYRTVTIAFRFVTVIDCF